MRGLLDTSVLIGLEAGRPVRELPDEGALSVVTLEEVALGVHMADQRGEHQTAQRRRATLAALAVFDVLLVDREVAAACAVIRADGRRRDQRFGPFDSLIAATAVVNELPLFTQDAQFADMPGVDVRLV